MCGRCFALFTQAHIPHQELRCFLVGSLDFRPHGIDCVVSAALQLTTRSLTLRFHRLKSCSAFRTAFDWSDRTVLQKKCKVQDQPRHSFWRRHAVMQQCWTPEDARPTVEELVTKIHQAKPPAISRSNSVTYRAKPPQAMSVNRMMDELETLETETKL